MNKKEEEILQMVRVRIQDYPDLDSEPSEPRPQECCGQSCKPCVFDIHRNDIVRWAKDCAKKMKYDDSNTLHNYVFGADDENPERNFADFELKSYVVFDIISTENLSTDTKLFRFENKNITNINRLPIGTHLRARINGDLSRQYTPTAIGPTWFEIPIKIYPNGKFTSKMCDITSLEFRGPYGSSEAEMILKVRRPMLVAAGTGIAPFIRILECLLEKDDDDLMITLVYTVRSFEDLLFFETLKRFAKFWNCQIRIYLTKEDNSNNSHPLIKISNGRLGIENFNKLFDEFNPLEVVVCGPPAFEKDICNFCFNRDVQFIRFPP